jgi:cation diffusion facilitator CzcD-associated flavoprotein CzcO
MRWKRFKTYYDVDSLFLEYVKNPAADTLRAGSEAQAREYMIRKCPPQYLDKIMPDYPVGCKRRVFDPGYLDALARKNVELRDDSIAAIVENGILMKNGSHENFDVIVYATGFHTQEYLSPMTIQGQDGKSLTDHWKETRGCQAYMGTTVSGFPNMAILFGPNASPAHNSVIFSLEVQAEYIIKTIMDPILTGRARMVTVKRSAEDVDCNAVQQKLADSVWHAGCTNWQLDENGRNCTSFPGYVRSYWWKLYSPRFQDYILKVFSTRAT